eukprot:4014030-Ditylum_brightwellii.AAC.1
MGGEQVFDEESLVDAVVDAPTDKCRQDVDSTRDTFVSVNQDAIDNLKVPKLKEELREYGIKGKGKASHLKEQLKKAM